MPLDAAGAAGRAAGRAAARLGDRRRAVVLFAAGRLRRDDFVVFFFVTMCGCERH